MPPRRRSRDTEPPRSRKSRAFPQIERQSRTPVQMSAGFPQLPLDSPILPAHNTHTHKPKYKRSVNVHSTTGSSRTSAARTTHPDGHRLLAFEDHVRRRQARDSPTIWPTGRRPPTNSPDRPELTHRRCIDCMRSLAELRRSYIGRDRRFALTPLGEALKKDAPGIGAMPAC